MKHLMGFSAPTVNTQIDFWPSMIDMLTSILMVFLLIYFVQYYLSNDNLEAALALQRRDHFKTLFMQEFDGEKDISLVAELNTLRISFGERVLFERKKYELQHRGAEMLEKLAQVFHKTQSAISMARTYKEIQIEGHTDSDSLDSYGYPHDNWELSTARALEVLKFLARKATPPLDESVMSANGYASNRPVKGDKAKSRRIEIRIFFSGADAAG